MGAIVDPSQRKSIDDYVQEARRDGAEVYQACATIPSNGCFYPPTLITGVQPVSRCVQEEVLRRRQVEIDQRKMWSPNPVFSKCVLPRRRLPKNCVLDGGVATICTESSSNC